MRFLEGPQYLYHRLRVSVKRIFDLGMWVSTLFFWKKSFSTQSVKNILLINLQGMGDLVMTTPFIDGLREQFPDAKITYLCSGKNGDIFASDDRIDVVHSYSGGFFDGRFLKLLSFVRNQNFDLCVSLFYAQHASFLALFSKAKYIMGPLYGLWSYTNFKTSLGSSQLTRDLRRNGSVFARQLGFGLSEFDDLHLSVDQSLKKSIHKKHIAPYLKKKDSLVIALHVESSWETKQWVPQRWKELILALQKKYAKRNPVFFFTGGKDNISVVREVVSLVSADVSAVNLSGKLSLPELVAFLDTVGLFVTVDAGPMHVASALGVKTVALFGVTQPDILVSESNLFKVVHNPLVHTHLLGGCFDFNNKPLKSCHVTMRQIGVEDVLGKVGELDV